MPTVTTFDGTELHYRDTGGDGPVLVLLHDLFRDSEMWAVQRRELAPEYRVITIDSRGHGRTVEIEAEYTLWDLARDGWDLVEALGVDRVVLGGHGQGGMVAQRMALQRPARVRALLLGDTDAAVPEPDSARTSAAVRCLLYRDDLTVMLPDITAPTLRFEGAADPALIRRFIDTGFTDTGAHPSPAPRPRSRPREW
ncbi:alpha/beta fold hydrolase [Nocardia heshunensis]